MADPKPARLPWQPPRVRRIASSDATAGANPIIPEGAFAFGS